MFTNRTAASDAGSVIPLGFILIIAIVSVTLIIFNTSTFPILGQNAEIAAHQDIESDFIRLDVRVYQTATTSVPQPVVMGNRVDYPFSLVPVKAPTPALKTHGPNELSIQNAQYTVNGTAYSATRDTSHITYSRDYNFFTNARAFGYEYGLVYSQPDGAEAGDSGIFLQDKQSVLNQNILTLVVLDGEIDSSRPAPTQVTITPVPSEEAHVSITNQPSNRVQVVMPTRLPESTWRDALDGQMVSNGGHLQQLSYSETNPSTGVDDGVHYVILDLEQGVTYEVNLYTVALDNY